MTSHSSSWGTVLLAAEGLGGAGGLAAFLTYRLKRREVRNSANKYMIDTARDLTETSLALLEPVRAAAASAQQEVTALRKQVRELESVVETLTKSLADLTAKSQAEHDDLQARLAAAESERDRATAELARRDAELNGQLRPAAGTV